MVEELNEQLQSQLDQTLSKKAREAIDAEKHIIEVEHKQAASEAAQVIILPSVLCCVPVVTACIFLDLG